MKTQNRIFIVMYFLLSFIFLTQPVHAIDPSRFVQINKTVLSMSENFFDQVTNMMGVTVEQTSGDAGTSKQFVTYKLNDTQKVEFYSMECGSGFSVSEISAGEEHKTVFYKNSNNKIEIENLHLGMSRNDVEKTLINGKHVSGGYVETQYVHDPNDSIKDSIVELSPETEKWKTRNELILCYSRGNKNSVAISIICSFDLEGRLIKFDIFYSSC